MEICMWLLGLKRLTMLQEEPWSDTCTPVNLNLLDFFPL